MLEQTLLLMQGVPGSGKSTRARVLSVQRHAVILSTDDFHYTPEGVYDFKRENAGIFHKMNQDRCRHFLIRGCSVIIDNTNITNGAANPYVTMAVALGIPIEFHRCSGVFLNTHGVPAGVVERMLAGMEILSVESALLAKPL